LLLAYIAETFIIPNNTEEQIFNSINDAYNKPRGMEKFISYLRTLEREKSHGFNNLAFINQKRIALLEKQKGSV